MFISRSARLLQVVFIFQALGKKSIPDTVGTTGNCLIYQGDLFVVVLFIRCSLCTTVLHLLCPAGCPKPLASADLGCFYSSLGEVTCVKGFFSTKEHFSLQLKEKKLTRPFFSKRVCTKHFASESIRELCVFRPIVERENSYFFYICGFFFLFKR